jgi:heptosyltransferase-2
VRAGHARPDFRLGLSDRIKFHENTASYPRLICDAVGLPYSGQRYRLYPSAEARRRAQRVLDEIGVQPHDRVVGLHTGAGKTFANKIWTPDRFVSLARRLIEDGDARVLLLGGPEERVHNLWIGRRLGDGVLDAGCEHAELVYASIVQRCDAIVCGDSLALHVAVAMGVPVVALFGPTCPQEIDLFGQGEKIVSDIACAPCYLRTCEKKPNCMDLLEVDQVHAAVRRVLAAAPIEEPAASVGG